MGHILFDISRAMYYITASVAQLLWRLFFLVKICFIKKASWIFYFDTRICLRGTKELIHGVESHKNVENCSLFGSMQKPCLEDRLSILCSSKTLLMFSIASKLDSTDKAVSNKMTSKLSTKIFKSHFNANC